MPLTPGNRFGPYEIVSPIGSGGMGDVYKARDTRLDRTVAIKVLPDHIAQREDRLARFEREARSVAGLNHPNICTLHDIGRHESHSYMVMELIEGETLAARLEKGALPFDQAQKFATQIADALDRAHRAGVTHRDVKPQNIMLTRDGVKVLDFGLAKSQSKPGPSEETLTQALTAEGTIMGTPQYMAPELFGGREADARADIWAFGAVLYEMVTGRKAFQGASYSSLVGAILATDPAPMTVKQFTPAWLERLVRRCLAKDPEDRWQSFRDIVLELQQPPPEAIVSTPSRRWSGTTVAAAGVCLALGLITGGLWIQNRARMPDSVVRLEVNPPDGGQFAPITDGGGSAISPDGQTLAFISRNSKGERLLHLRSLSSGEVRTLAGTENAARPFWSPDSKSIGFFSFPNGPGGSLKRIDLAGGPPVTLHESRNPRGGTWNQQSLILFGDTQTALRRISASGGKAEAVSQPNAGENHYYPQFLPDGKHFLYLSASLVSATGTRAAALFLGSLDSKEVTRVAEAGYKSLYDPTSGKLLYLREPGKLLAQTLELNPPRLTGEPVTVAQGIGVTANNRFADFSVSNDGTLFFGQQDGAGRMLQFGWRDRSGKMLEAAGPPVAARMWYDLSPDERRFVSYAEVAADVATDLWVSEFATGLRTRLTFENPRGAAWSPDGRSIYYYSSRSGSVKRKSADGNGEAETLVEGVSPGGVVWDVSPDGQYLLYLDRTLMLLPLTGDKKPRLYLKSNTIPDRAEFSPDGRWVAYDSSESGRSEIYAQGFPEPQGKKLISAEGGIMPHWRPDGREIYWVRPDRMLMAAPTEFQPGGVKVGRAEALFKVSDAGGTSNFRPSRDGQRFLVLEPPKGADADPPMVVVLNWAAALRK